MTTWISLRDEHPPLHTEVLLHYLDGTILIGCRFQFGYLFEELYGKITHWTPLPAPPA